MNLKQIPQEIPLSYGGSIWSWQKQRTLNAEPYHGYILFLLYVTYLLCSKIFLFILQRAPLHNISIVWFFPLVSFFSPCIIFLLNASRFSFSVALLDFLLYCSVSPLHNISIVWFSFPPLYLFASSSLHNYASRLRFYLLFGFVFLPTTLSAYFS